MSNALDDKTCGVAKTLKIIGSKWTLLILRDLLGGKNRFGLIQRSLEGISPKTLSERLRQLEKQGIIKRKIFRAVPLHVEYSLTPKGKSLNQIVAQMKKWGMKC